jgi:hypothetical protein
MSVRASEAAISASDKLKRCIKFELSSIKKLIIQDDRKFFVNNCGHFERNLIFSPSKTHGGARGSAVSGQPNNSCCTVIYSADGELRADDLNYDV